MSRKTDKKAEKEECEEEPEEPEYADDWRIWTEPLDELSEIEDALKVDGKIELRGKTILDIGTDFVKPLYIALKFEPKKIIGISDDLPDFSSDVAEKSKLLTKTKINFYDCNFFNEETLEKIREKEKIIKFDIVLLSKTLHHLRTGKCIKNHTCRDDEKCCIYKFEEQEVFERLFRYGKKVIVYECFYPDEKDKDKIRGRGGYFTTPEWRNIFDCLSAEKYKVELIRPRRCDLDELLKKKKEELDKVLRQVDCVCFCVEPR